MRVLLLWLWFALVMSGGCRKAVAPAPTKSGSQSYSVKWQNDSGAVLRDVSATWDGRAIVCGDLEDRKRRIGGTFPLPMPSEAQVSWTTADKSKHTAMIKIRALAPRDFRIGSVLFSMRRDGSVAVSFELLNQLNSVGSPAVYVPNETAQAKAAREATDDLFAAIDRGDMATIRQSLERGADRNAPLRGHGPTPLEEAASANQYDAAQFLFEHGAQLGDAFRFAARSGTPKLLEMFVAHGAVIRPTGQPFRTPLFEAVSFGKLDNARWLLDRGANVNQSMSDGQTPIHAAAMIGDLDIAKLLVERGAKVNVRTASGATPMMMSQAGLGLTSDAEQKRHFTAMIALLKASGETE